MPVILADPFALSFSFFSGRGVIYRKPAQEELTLSMASLSCCETEMTPGISSERPPAPPAGPPPSGAAAAESGSLISRMKSSWLDWISSKSSGNGNHRVLLVEFKLFSPGNIVNLYVYMYLD